MNVLEIVKKEPVMTEPYLHYSLINYCAYIYLWQVLSLRSFMREFFLVLSDYTGSDFFQTAKLLQDLTIRQSMEYHTAFISVGSNLGDKLLNCQNGIAALERSGASKVKDRSMFYKTEPVDYKDQDWFINGVVKIETLLDPFRLLDELKSIEHKAGRGNDTIKFGPRILDLDIVIYDNVVIKSSTLIVPHPRMHKRRFVLKPFCDIAPNIVHPVFKKDIRYLLDNLEDNGEKVVLLKCDY